MKNGKVNLLLKNAQNSEKRVYSTKLPNLWPLVKYGDYLGHFKGKICEGGWLAYFGRFWPFSSVLEDHKTKRNFAAGAAGEVAIFVKIIFKVKGQTAVLDPGGMLCHLQYHVYIQVIGLHMHLVSLTGFPLLRLTIKIIKYITLTRCSIA